MKKIMDGNEACSYVSYNFTEVAGIYPITPASPMAELTDKWSNEGKLNYVIDEVIALLPMPFRLLITRETIKKFIQKVFDETKKALDYKK